MNVSGDQLTLAKRICKDDFVAFCQFVKHDYQVNWHHEILGKTLERAYNTIMAGGKARIIIEIPPRHGKSETSTILFPTWVLGRAPELPIITASHSAEMAEWFGMKARDVMQSDYYKAIFGTRLREDSQSKSKWLTQKNGGFLAAGIGGSITGRGFKIGIIDDPIKNRQDAESSTVRDLVWDWYTSTFYTRQEGNSAIIVIMTRWHTDDLVGRLLVKEKEDAAAGRENYDHWEVVRFPAIAEADEEHRKAGEPLWPKKFDKAFFESTKAAVGIYDWSSMYQQNPITSENQEFKQEYFRYFENSDIQNLNLQCTTTVDLAISQKSQADETVIMTIGKDPFTSRWFILETTHGHFDPLGTIDAIFMHQSKYRSRVFVESVAYQKALQYFILEEQRRRGQFFLVDEIKNARRGKEERIRGLLPYYRAGAIYHRKTNTLLEDQLLEFPFGKHDDHPDALSMQLEAVAPTVPYQEVVLEHTYDNLSDGI